MIKGSQVPPEHCAAQAPDRLIRSVRPHSCRASQTILAFESRYPQGVCSAPLNSQENRAVREFTRTLLALKTDRDWLVRTPVASTI